jgi:hypothetical protein
MKSSFPSAAEMPNRIELWQHAEPVGTRLVQVADLRPKVRGLTKLRSHFAQYLTPKSVVRRSHRSRSVPAAINQLKAWTPGRELQRRVGAPRAIDQVSMHFSNTKYL